MSGDASPVCCLSTKACEDNQRAKVRLLFYMTIVFVMFFHFFIKMDTLAACFAMVALQLT